MKKQTIKGRGKEKAPIFRTPTKKCPRAMIVVHLVGAETSR
jgi:hypothetical protein